MPLLNCDGIFVLRKYVFFIKKDTFLPLLFYDDKNGRVW